MRLLLIDIEQHDPLLNLEIEKKLLDIKDDYFVIRFWQNTPSVFLGKYQNHQFELNQSYLKQHSIPYFYRFTGGGTVYHDLGNLNITFSKPKAQTLENPFGKKDSRLISECVKNAISAPSVDFEVSDRNAIYFKDKKLMGSAMSLTRDKFLFHASLLINSDLEQLRGCINWEPNYPEADKKIVHSIRNEVINLSQINPISLNEVKQRFISEIKEIIKPNQTLLISEESQLAFFFR